MRRSGDVPCSYKKSANDSFEWYYGCDTLKDVFSDYFDASANISLLSPSMAPSPHVLVVGNGNSDLCEDMAKCHAGKIVGIDISDTVTKEMNEKHKKNLEQFPSM